MKPYTEMIYHKVLAAMLEADEMGGSEDEEYIELMSKISSEALHRSNNCYHLMVQTRERKAKAMKLVYVATGEEVVVGDQLTLNGETVQVAYFRPPHMPSSSGKVSVAPLTGGFASEYFVGVIGAKWINRTDQG